MTELDLDAVWNALPNPAFILDGEDTILSANPAAEAFSATSLRHLKGAPLARFFRPGSPVPGALAQLRRSGLPVAQYDVSVAWANHPPQDLSIQAVPIRETAGQVLLILQQRGMAEQMDRRLIHRSAARSVTGLAAMLAHEIRNPLAGISGAAQLLAMTLDDESREFADLIRQEAERIGALVDSFEKFGEQGPMQRRPFNIHDALGRARRAAQAGFAAHLRFREEFDPSLPLVLGDPDQILQAFQNLLKNAAEAAPPSGGLITLRTAYRPGVKMARPGGASESLPLTVSVCDNGPGIPEALADDIFDPFVSSKVNGTGLGLSLVSKIVTDHGGVIDCDSRPGRTEFLLRLPICRDADAATEKES